MHVWVIQAAHTPFTHALQYVHATENSVRTTNDTNKRDTHTHAKNLSALARTIREMQCVFVVLRLTSYTRKVFTLVRDREWWKNFLHF